MMAVVAGAVAGGLSVVGGRDRTIAGLRHELTNAHSQLLTATQRGDATGGTLDALRAKVAGLRKELVKSKDAANGGAATKTVTKWVPNGEAVPSR
jgi:capsule polysaccharide export protein KpsE/RkpR